MNKKMREILAKIQEKTNEARAEEDVVKASAIMDEVDSLQKEYDLEKRIFEAEKAQGIDEAKEPVKDSAKEAEVDAITKFAQDARRGFYLEKGLNEGTLADGGYTVPEDVQTRINEYRDAKASLLQEVRVEKVTTNKGSRTFKKRAQQTGFSKVAEGGKIGSKATPQFERISYEIDKYAGYFPVTNEVLADTDANLAQVLIEWIGDESRITANKLIIGAIDDNKPITEFTGLDDIKKAFNVTLGSAFAGTSKIITNDNGLQYLDTLKDTTGRYLLAPMPGDTMMMALQVGARNIPVRVVPNEDLPNRPHYVATTDTSVTSDKDYYVANAKGIIVKVESPTGNPKTSNYLEISATKEAIPFICGDLKESVVYWDRQQRNIKVSDIASIGTLNAYEEDLTIYRAIEREDVTARDLKGLVNGFIAVNK